MCKGTTVGPLKWTPPTHDTTSLVYSTSPLRTPLPENWNRHPKVATWVPTRVRARRWRNNEEAYYRPPRSRWRGLLEGTCEECLPCIYISFTKYACTMCSPEAVMQKGKPGTRSVCSPSASKLHAVQWYMKNARASCSSVRHNLSYLVVFRQFVYSPAGSNTACATVMQVTLCMLGHKIAKRG